MKKLAKKQISTLIGALILISLAVPGAMFALNSAATGWRTTPSFQYINAHSTCWDTNSTTNQYFVPTKTSSEWNTFIGAAGSIADINLQNCNLRPCESSSGTYSASGSGTPAGSVRTEGGRWVDNADKCLQPWTNYIHSPHYDDNERSGPPLTRTINICSNSGPLGYDLGLSNGDQFFITTDVMGGSWVIKISDDPVKQLGTAVFQKGTPADSNMVNGTPQSSSNKSHQSNRNYDGNCLVTIQSWQGHGNRTDFHHRALALFNIGEYIPALGGANWGGEPTGEVDFCQTGNCVGTDPNSNTWQSSGFGSCSAFCGGGTQTEIWTCVNTSGQPASPCLAEKPASATQACNTAACGSGGGVWQDDPGLYPGAATCVGNAVPTGACSTLGQQCNVETTYKGSTIDDTYVCLDVPAIWIQSGFYATGTQCPGNNPVSGSCSPEGNECHTSYTFKGNTTYERYQCGQGSGPVNGTCGGAHGGSYTSAAAVNNAGLCGAGTASPASVSGSGPWSWNCNGSGGGSNAACSATQTSNGNWVETSTGNSTVGSYPTNCTGNNIPTGTCSPLSAKCHVDYDFKGTITYSYYDCN